MIWFPVILAAAFLTFRSLYKSDVFTDFDDDGHHGFLGWVGLFFGTAFVTLIISLPLLGAAAWIGTLPQRIGVIDHSYPLVALKERDGIQGQFYFLGAGHIGTTGVYFWYRRNPDGSVSGGNTTQDPCSHIYESAAAPSMTTYKTAYADQTQGALVGFFGLDMRDAEDWCPNFNIPPNSIEQGYSL